MSRAADRRAQQADLEREWTRQQQERPNEPDTPLARSSVLCSVGRGACDFTMRGRDNILRCWYCARRKP